MKIKLSILAAVLGTAGCLTSIGMAAEPGDFSSSEDQVLILKEFDRLHFETPVAADLAVMNVRVFGPDNEILLTRRTMGESVDFMVNSGLSDGEYRYEVVSIFGNVDLSDKSKYVPGEETMLRKFGTFKVSNGYISDETNSSRHDDASLLDRVIERAVNLAGITLNVLVPSAHAADLTASSSVPKITFDDSDQVGTEWTLKGNGHGNFYLTDLVGTNNHNPFFINALAGVNSTRHSIYIDADGDIHWAENLMNFDKGLTALSLGTSSIRADLSISSLDPGINMYDEGTADSMGIEYDGIDFNVINYVGQDTVAINWAAPVDSLHIQGTGFVGLGTSNPQSRLDVIGDIRTSGYFRGQSINPGFWIDETGAGNKGANVVLDGGVLQFQRRAQGFGAYEAAPIRVFINAPMNSFVVNASGYLGLGINPTTPIHSVNGARLSIGGVWQNSSSRDLKENIHDLDSAEALAAFKALEPVTFNYKVDSEETYIGFIAEDVPEIVASNDRATLSSMDIIALLTQVVQDQQNTIENQAQLVEHQNERMDQLETMIRLVSGLENTDAEVAVNAR